MPIITNKRKAFISVDTGNTYVDNAIKDYLNLFVIPTSNDDSSLTIAVGLGEHNSIINSKKSYTKNNFGWYADSNSVYFNNKPIGSKPWVGLVGGFRENIGSDDFVFAMGKEIEGVVAAVKRLVNARDKFFVPQLYNSHTSIIEDTDILGISVFDLMHNEENSNKFNNQRSPEFQKVVENILEDNNFEVSIKTVRTVNDNTTLRLKNVNSDFSDSFKEAVVGNTKPVVLSRGIHSNLLTWNDFAKDIATDKDSARDTWLIEMVGGPTIDEDCGKYDCPDYTFSDLKIYYWPALIAGVQNYSGKKQLDYVGFSLGCSAALESLELYQSTGKLNAGYVFDSITGNYLPADLSSNPVDTFVAVACPGNFTRLSTFMQAFNETFGYVNWSTRFIYGNHIKGNHINKEIIDTLKIINPKLADNLPPIVKFGLGKEGGYRMSMDIYKAFYEWINDPNQPKLGYGVDINNFLVIQGKSRNSYLENSLPHTWNNLESDTVVSTFDESEICTNIDSDNKYYASFEGLVHGGPISAIPEDPNVQSAIKEFLTTEKLSTKFNPKINNCEII